MFWIVLKIVNSSIIFIKKNYLESGNWNIKNIVKQSERRRRKQEKKNRMHEEKLNWFSLWVSPFLGSYKEISIIVDDHP